MEIFDGQNNTLILYDSSPFDEKSLDFALSFQFTSKEYRMEDKVVVLDLSEVPLAAQKEYINLTKKHAPQQFYIFRNDVVPEAFHDFSNKSILYKGAENTPVGQFFRTIKNRKHKTWIEFNLNAIQHNINCLKSCLPQATKTLVMVKAASYGTGDVRIPHFLQQMGIDYLGVAFVDEGVILREKNISIPLFVINTEINAFEDIVDYRLEPAIFSFRQLQSLCRFLKKEGITDFPIHLAMETGMNRLGFNEEELDVLISTIKESPHVYLKGVYSHLADADNRDFSFSLQQINRFKQIEMRFNKEFKQPILFHLLNSEGIAKFGTEAGFDMARLGIGIYGYISTAKEIGLKPTLCWFTTISQIKTVKAGESIGYGRTFVAPYDMKIATLLVGYADGFSRKLSNGVGSVIINGENCPVVGNVCMDMTMVDVSAVKCKEGESAEIIGNQITMEDFSQRVETISYEVMTRIDKRVAKVYLFENDK